MQKYGRTCSWARKVRAVVSLCMADPTALSTRRVATMIIQKVQPLVSACKRAF